MSKKNGYKAVVVGVSAGGMDALPRILKPLPKNFPLPIIIVQHTHPSGDDGFFVRYLNQRCKLEVIEATENQPIEDGKVYLAPADRHLLIEQDRLLALSTASKVNHSRPSIDVLFESAAEVYDSGLIAIILTGATADGARGMKKIDDCGGITIAQNPETAKAPAMPKAAIEACEIDYVLPLENIPEELLKLTRKVIFTSSLNQGDIS